MSKPNKDLRLPWKRVDGEDPSGPASWNEIQTKDGYFVLRDGSDPRVPCRAYMDFIVEAVNNAHQPMKVVNVLESGSVALTLLVRNRNHPKRSFEKDFDAAIKKASEQNPCDWQLPGEIKKLSEKGWEIIFVKALEVTP